MGDPQTVDGWSIERAAMTDRVVADARRLYHHLADDRVIEGCARRAVAEIWPGALKVTSFVPVLAMRRVHETLAADGGAPVGQVLAPVGG